MNDGFETFAVCASETRIFVDPLDSRGKALVARSGCVHPMARAAWIRLLHSAQWDCVVDVGANYGEMLVDADLPSSAVVVAVEPNPRVLPYLRATLQCAGIPAEVWPVAVSSQNGQAVLEVDETWSGNSAIIDAPMRPAGHTIDTVLVGTVTMGTLLARLQLPEPTRLLVKIDVEGHELAVLRGLLESRHVLTECAVLVEVVRMDAADLDWVVERFSVRLLDLAKERLVHAVVGSGKEVEAFLSSGRYYERDVVLEPRR